MSKESRLQFLLFVIICVFAFDMPVKSQLVANTFFIDNSPVRNEWNPSYQSDQNFYIGLPLLTGFQFSNGSNEMTMQDFIFNGDVYTNYTFLHPKADKKAFMEKMKSDLELNGGLEVGIFDLGFRVKDNYFTFAIKGKASAETVIPKDLFRFILLGNSDNDQFDFKSLSADYNLYYETSVGYSRKIKNINLGFKVKALNGLSTLSFSQNNFTLNAGSDMWSYQGQGQLLASTVPGTLNFVDDTLRFTYFDKFPTYFKPYGTGLAADIGVSGTFMKNLNLGISVRDLGYINWNKHTDIVNYQTSFNFNGIPDRNLSNNDIRDVNYMQIDSIQAALIHSIKVTNEGGNAFTSYLVPKLNFSAQYYFLKNRLSLGFLGQYDFKKSGPVAKYTGAIGIMPVQWFNAALTYTNYHNNLNLLGLGVGVKKGIFYFSASTDYCIPPKYAAFPLKYFNQNLAYQQVFLPYTTQQFNLSLGLKIVLNTPKTPNLDPECNCYR